MRTVILNFHGLGRPARALEPGEAAYWIDPGFFEEILDLAAHHAGRARVRFTFDDGNASDAEIAAPALARRGERAIFFVLADRIGGAGSLDASALAALGREGHGIGSHGAAHVDWRTLDEAGRAREFADARARIAAAAGRPVDRAAVPFGRYRAGTLAALRRAGFREVHTSDGGAARAGALVQPRTSVRADMDGAAVERVILGREPLTASLRRRAAVAAKRVV